MSKSESGPLELDSCFPVWNLVGGLGKRSKNWREEDCGEIVEEFYAATPWRETRQGWVKRRVGGFHTRGTRAAVPHLGAALLNGKNGDNKKSVGVVDDINEGNTDIVVGRDCELTCGCELCQSAVSKQADG